MGGNSIKILCIGASGAGKTAFFNRLIRFYFSDSSLPTSNINFEIFNRDEDVFSFWDLGSTVALQKGHLEETTAILFFVDLSQSIAVQIAAALQRIQSIGDIPVMMVGAKIDLMEQTSQIPLTLKEECEKHGWHFIGLFSAKDQWCKRENDIVYASLSPIRDVLLTLVKEYKQKEIIAREKALIHLEEEKIVIRNQQIRAAKRKIVYTMGCLLSPFTFGASLGMSCLWAQQYNDLLHARTQKFYREAQARRRELKEENASLLHLEDGELPDARLNRCGEPKKIMHGDQIYMSAEQAHRIDLLTGKSGFLFWSRPYKDQELIAEIKKSKQRSRSSASPKLSRKA